MSRRHWTDECVSVGHSIIRARHYFWGGQAQVLKNCYATDPAFSWIIIPAISSTAGYDYIEGCADTIEEAKTAVETMLGRLCIEAEKLRARIAELEAVNTKEEHNG